MSLLFGRRRCAAPGLITSSERDKQKSRNARFGRSGGRQPGRSIVTIPTNAEAPASKVDGFYAGRGDGSRAAIDATGGRQAAIPPRSTFPLATEDVEGR